MDVAKTGRQKFARSWSVKLDRVGFEVGNGGGRLVTLGVRACLRQSFGVRVPVCPRKGEIDGEECIWRRVSSLMKNAQRRSAHYLSEREQKKWFSC